MKKNNVYRLTTTAVLLALGTALSFVKIYELPLGGAVTLLSMLPICLISLFYGTAYAVLPCVLYGAIQMCVGGIFGWGLTPTVLVGGIVFDYLLAFGVLCLAGLFRNRGTAGAILGTVLALVLRFVCHYVSGCIFFRSFDIYNNPYIYSLVYNGSYMLPELVLTLIGAFILYKSGAFARICKLVKE